MWNISLKNKLVAYKGSPRYSTTPATGYGGPRTQFWTSSGYPDDETVGDTARLAAIIKKIEALRLLFANNGKTLEIQSIDGSTKLRCNPRVKELIFPENIWYEVLEYEIQLEADVIYIDGVSVDEDSFTYYLSEASEEWQLEFGEFVDTYKLTHSISAKGKSFYSTTGDLVRQAWQEAKAYVQSKIGIDFGFAYSGLVLNVPTYYGGWDRRVNERIDKSAGTVSLEESWILSSGNYLEEFKTESKTSSESPFTEVVVDGTIKGLVAEPQLPPISGTKLAAAESAFSTIRGNLLSRAQTYSGKTLNVLPLSTTIGKNQNEGVLTYSFAYNNRPSNYFSNALSEKIQLTDNNKTRVTPKIQVLGRPRGPIFQDIGSFSSKTRDLTIDLILPHYSGSIGSLQNWLAWKPDVGSLTSGLMPTATDTSLENDSEIYDPLRGNYSKRIQWQYTADI